jgi:hypothetical protein
MSSSLINAVRLDPTCGIDVAAHHLEENEQRDLLRALAAVPDPRHRRGVRYRAFGDHRARVRTTARMTASWS